MAVRKSKSKKKAVKKKAVNKKAPPKKRLQKYSAKDVKTEVLYLSSEEVTAFNINEFKNLSYGDQVDALCTMDDAIKKIKTVLTKYDGLFKVAKQLLESELIEEKSTGVAGSMGDRVAIDKTVVAQFKNWDQFCKYVARNKAFYLFQRRINNSEYRDKLEQGKQIPGLEPFTKKSLRIVRKKKKV